MRPLLVAVGLLVVSCSAPSPSVSSVTSPCVPCQQAAPVAAVHAPRSAALDELAARRIELARKRIQHLRAGYERGTSPLSELLRAYRDVAVAARDSDLHGEALRRAVLEYRDAMSQLKELTRTRVAGGSAPEDAVTQVECAIAEADYWLAEASDNP